MSWGWLMKTLQVMARRDSRRLALGGLVAFGMALALAGCQHTPVTDTSSRYFLIPAGATFNLRKPFTIPPQEAHIYIQNGAVHRQNGTNLYYPHCKLGVKDISEAPRTVEPDDFEIRKVRRYVDDILLVYRGGLELAALDLRLAQGDGGSDGPTEYMYVTAMRLHSERQPQVRSLHCQQLDDPGVGWYATYDEIRQTLGDVATIRLPGEGPTPEPGQ